jgi:5-(carboxyamino)imidazole ribonucleotide mutase
LSQTACTHFNDRPLDRDERRKQPPGGATVVAFPCAPCGHPGVRNTVLAQKRTARIAHVRTAKERMAQRKAAPQVGVVMGSDSDWDVMRHAAAQLEAFGVAHETRVLSAHRMPDEMFEYAEDAATRGLRAIIAGAGGAAHLPGMLAAKTTVPVLGVPVPSKYLRGEDSLLSIVQMPTGIPVATFAIGEAGAANAALFAVAMLAAADPSLARKLAAFRQRQTATARAMRVPPG